MSTPRRPNILVMMADQLKFDALGCYGNNEVHTPNIDRIALNGSTFDSHYIQSPMCVPSRCAFITGRYPKNNGARDNGIALPDSEITLAETLRENGYLTAAIGKMHFTTQFVPKENEEDDWPSDKYGFEVVHTTCDCKTGEYLEWLKRESQKDFEEVQLQGKRKAAEDRASAADKDTSGPPQLYKSDVNPKYHQSTWIGNQAIEFIERATSEEEKRPFFAFVSWVDPHHPFDPPEPYASMYDPDKLSPAMYTEGELDDKPRHFMQHRCGRGFSNEKYDYRKLTDRNWRELKAAYYGMISLIDNNVGRVMDCLKEKGILNDTVVIFTSDHGELMGDHGLLFKGPFHYDSIIKAPFVMSWPGVVPCGSRFAHVTQHIDIMPTILEYAGCRPPLGCQGMSMVPILRGDQGGGREFAMCEFKCYDWGLNLRTIVNRDYKFTYYAGKPFGELYDRNADPEEKVNLWNKPEYADVKARLMRELLDRLIETEDTLPLRTGKY